ncbi:MAG: DNA repair protein RadA [Patescibacteria group bacterium]
MPNKNEKIFVCQKCDAQSPKWSGRCLNCGAWGTIEESIANKSPENKQPIHFSEKNLIDFASIKKEEFPRLLTKISEVDQILGGGIVPGSLILLGGEPGIGKSTIVMQILKNLAINAPTLLYISGEESATQIKMRSDRLNYDGKNLKFLPETNVAEICGAIEKIKPTLAIIDSIQTIYTDQAVGERGGVSQIRTATTQIMETAKKTNVPVILIGHVTKDGSVAGPKTLEHLVDVVIYLEGEKFQDLRIMRSSKNRFGNTNEIGVFEMTELGLMEIKDPSRIFLAPNFENIAGSVVSATMEGSRAFLIEVQSLVTPTIFGYPQRKCSGFEITRLQMLSAVLFKRASLNLNTQDIHLNIVGGFDVSDPAIDLPVAMAIFSAFKNQPVDRQTIYLGEIGLGGELRPVANLEKRLAEAKKLGFATAVIPEMKLVKDFGLKIVKIKNIKEIQN